MADKPVKLPDIVPLPDSGVTVTKNPDSSISISLGANEVGAKEMIFAAGGLLVAAILFFIIKGFVAKSLVANSKKSPRAAEVAGWSLFGLLMLASVGAALGILDSTKFLSWPYLVPIGVAMLALLVTFVIALTSRR